MIEINKANVYNNPKLNNACGNVSLQYSGAFFALVTALF